LCGRNFEYLGEDPYLTSSFAVPYIIGVQEQGVGACIKHFALNNQEVNRKSINVEVSEQALREIYLPAFEAAVKKANVVAVMGAYNKFRGTYCCHNFYLLTEILRKEWNFKEL
jgi:beta-glucosidase